MILNAEHHERMERQGYCVLERVFSHVDMDSLARSIERYQEEHQRQIALQGGTAGISRADEITFTSHLAEKDPDIMRFCRRPELIDITTSLLGPDVDLYWNQSVYKMPEGIREFPWHQDDGYTPVFPTPYLTLWLAINDATLQNGCISVLPGSHKEGLLPHVSTPLGLTCHDNDHHDQGEKVPVSAGSLAAFWSLTAHKSGPNSSDSVRKAYIIQYSKSGLVSLRTGEVIEAVTPIARDGIAVAAA